MKRLIVIALACMAQPALAECTYTGWTLEFGIGAHDVSIDGPEYTTPNMLGNVELRYTTHPMKAWPYMSGIASVSHTSSLRGFPDVWNSPGEDGYGANVLWLKGSIPLSRLWRN